MQDAALIWRERNVPVSVRYADPYFSLDDGFAEAAHVFLGGNGLPDRFRPGFHIAELGFGTGLNALAAAHAWEARGVAGRLRVTSFEAFPVAAPDMARALARWAALGAWARPLVAAWEAGARRIALACLDLEVIVGDARTTLPGWAGRADAWFLDGFSPAKNPELWEPGLLVEVARHTAPGGTCATYSAARPVREALVAAGFRVERLHGYGRKRHMVRGALPDDIVTGRGDAIPSPGP